METKFKKETKIKKTKIKIKTCVIFSIFYV